jgi:hypothetical protein
MKTTSAMRFLLFFLLNINLNAQAIPVLSMANNSVRLRWENAGKGWQIKSILVKKGQAWVSLDQPSGEHTLLYSSEKPQTTPDSVFKSITGKKFPEDIYHYQKQIWAESTNPISLNTAGQAIHFFAQKGQQLAPNHLRFEHETEHGNWVMEWRFDPRFPTDILLTQTFRTNKAGYYALASPSLATISEKNLAWASVPGYFQGNYIQPNFALSYAYGHGVPALPVIYRERSASTLAPLVSTKNGLTLALIVDPRLCRDPWAEDKNTHQDWNIGISHKNRRALLSPTQYYPVLGEPKSQLKAGEDISYTARYHLGTGGWFQAIQHAAYEVYQLKSALALRQSKQSLSSRIQQMHHYLTDPQTSMWNIEEFQGRKIGAQSYLGGVVGSNKDAMKNSDYGAMWMLANATQDTLLKTKVLPYALNFKIAQQINEPGFFNGALAGQYYLAKRKKFVEEWGEVVEPIAVTFYTMLDLGNILLFESHNTELKERLRAGAEWLLKNQKPNGSWAVAYDRNNEAELYLDIQDLRATFYGLLVAYRILKDSRYLVAAKKGADWLLQAAVAKGSYLGVCGDMRYAPDFATAQTAQAFLDLFELTQEEKYKKAAVEAAKVYTTSIYTHPIPGTADKTVNGIMRKDWEIAQAGLSFEHGGIFGSANIHGPIQLCSHAGLFIRMYQITKAPIFADLARAGAWGRDAFVDSATSVASYYWNAMNRGAGPYPHHAWWQIGWLTDYLMAEAELRSNGKVRFPRGFVTPKVGPHQTYGFAPGVVNGQKAHLIVDEKLVKIDHPAIDYLLAMNEKKDKIHVILMNNRLQATDFQISFKGAVAKAMQLPGLGFEVLTLDL